MAEAVLLAVTKIGIALGDEAIKAIVAKLSEKITNFCELPMNLEFIGRELSMMNAVIQDQGTSPNLNNNVVKCWIAELRKLGYYVEDVMDKYSYHAFQLQVDGSLKKNLRRAHFIKVFSEIADEIVKIRGHVEHVRSLKTWFPERVLTQRNGAGSQRQGFQGRLPEIVEDEGILGKDMDQKMKDLTKWLGSNEPDSKLLTISGMGGLGKTTLVLNFWRSVETKFDILVLLSVSQYYNVYELLKAMLKKIIETEQEQTGKDDGQPYIKEGHTHIGVHDLKEKIRRKLEGKKCLLVLDDVWHQEVYHKLCDAFMNLQDFRIIITTRREDVGNLSSCHHMKLRPLDDLEAFELFCRKAFRNRKDRTCPAELKEVATSIVKRCKGLPLAIVSMGSLLSSKNPTNFGWKQMANQFMDDLAKSDDAQEILSLSYNDLPGNLRNCFLYCSLFPEDYIISRESVVRQWVAEGFATSIGNNTAEDVAELNLMELISRNMLQVVELDDLGRVSTFKMHDIVRELALYIAKEEKFGLANNRGALIRIEKDVRRLSSYGWKEGDASKVSFPLLRTLISIEALTYTPQMLASVLSESCYLTVLELQDSAITEVPSSIENLFNLRYIGLRRTRVNSLPECIKKLSNLQTLDIKQTKVEKLPRGIHKLKKLRHLLADRMMDENQSNFVYFVGIQIPNNLSSLEELQSLETVQASDDLVDQLKEMNKIQSLWIDGIKSTISEKLCASLSTMPLLSNLLISASDDDQVLSMETLNPNSRQFYKLIVRGRWASGMLQCPIFQGHGTNLMYLALSWSGLTEDPLSLLAPHVPNLDFMSLNRVSSVETLVVSDGCFPKLRTLVLKNFLNVNQITIGNGALQSIEGLYVVTLLKLDKVPEGMETLTTLKKLWLLNLHGNFKVQWGAKEMHTKMAHVLEVRV